MSLRFPYPLITSSQSVRALGGRWVRPRPIVPLTVIGPNGTFGDDALLDTGSDESLLPLQAAARLGLDLSNAPVVQVAGVGSTSVTVRQAEVRLLLTDGAESREWPAWVGFAANLRRPLLGFAGCLQFFTATFHGDREQVELAANGLYPGT